MTLVENEFAVAYWKQKWALNAQMNQKKISY